MDKTKLEQLAAEERKAYFRAWRAANKEKTAEHRRRFWEKKALERLEARASDNIQEPPGPQPEAQQARKPFPYL